VAAQLDADSAFSSGSSAVPSLPEQPVEVDLSKARVLRLGRARPEVDDPSQILYLDISLGGGTLAWQLPALADIAVLIDVSGMEVRAGTQALPITCMMPQHYLPSPDSTVFDIQVL
jgi:hypothetical protein